MFRPWLYLAPAILTLVVWIYWPLFDAVRLSFFQWNMLPTSPQKFVGWENYARILALPKFWQALRNTGLYVLGLLPLAVLVPLALAIYTHDLPARSRNIYRAIIFVPMIIAPVVAARGLALAARPRLRHGQYRHHLARLRSGQVPYRPQGRHLDGDRHHRLEADRFFDADPCLAANANINPSLVEAARMDGASKWEITRDVRLPLLSSSILFLVMMTILLGAQWSFTYINVLTGGGPLGATTNIYYLLWDFGFSSMSVGWSSASAVILFLGFGAIAFFLFKLIDRYSFHDN